jgi:hypothetical protein
LDERGTEARPILCNYCRVETRHLLRARHCWYRNTENNVSIDAADLSDDVDGICKHQNSIWTCAGCDTVTFEWQLLYGDSENSEKWVEGDGGYYPDRSQDSLQPKSFLKLNAELSRLYREIVTCFNDDCLLLCTIGLRALIEGVCKDKGFKDGNLEHKIDGLAKFVPNLNLIEALHAFRFAGNEAAHRLELSSLDDTKMAIEILEDLLNFLYDLDYKATQIRSTSQKTGLKMGKTGSVH